MSGVKGGRLSGAAGSDWGGRHRIIATDNIIKHYFSDLEICISINSLPSAFKFLNLVGYVLVVVEGTRYQVYIFKSYVDIRCQQFCYF